MCIKLEQCEVSWIPLFTDDLLVQQVCLQVRSVMNINLDNNCHWYTEQSNVFPIKLLYESHLIDRIRTFLVIQCNPNTIISQLIRKAIIVGQSWHSANLGFRTVTVCVKRVCECVCLFVCVCLCVCYGVDLSGGSPSNQVYNTETDCWLCPTRLTESLFIYSCCASEFCS